MFNLIKSYRANNYWVRAHAKMGGQFQGVALVSIRKAVDLEPDIEKIPKYLELQGHIESSIGKMELASKSFKQAIKIIRGNPSSFKSKESKALENRIHEALEEIKKG